MLMGKIVGHIVSTRKNEKLVGSKIMEVQLMENDELKNKFIVALDSVGAGIGERVLITTGCSARLAMPDQTAPTDAVIVGIVD